MVSLISMLLKYHLEYTLIETYTLYIISSSNVFLLIKSEQWQFLGAKFDRQLKKNRKKVVTYLWVSENTPDT